MASALETQETRNGLSQLETPTPAVHEPESQPGAGGEQTTSSWVTRERKQRKELAPLEREPGKSLLPFSKVKKILKADEELPLLAKEATFLISLATEEFIKNISEASQRVADRDRRRTTVSYQDVATAVNKNESFFFLKEIIPWVPAAAPVKRTKIVEPTRGGLLDKFVTRGKAETSDEAEGEGEDDSDIGEGYGLQWSGRSGRN